MAGLKLRFFISTPLELAASQISVPPKNLVLNKHPGCLFEHLRYSKYYRIKICMEK